MSKRPDKNLISIEGTAAGGVLVNGVLALPGAVFEFEAGGRILTARLELADDGMRHLYLPEIVPPDGTYADPLKITGQVRDLHVHTPRIVGAREDCVDLNSRVRRIIVGDDDTIWEPRGRYLATIKGGSRDVELRGVVVTPTRVDRIEKLVVHCDLGNHSDQSRERTENVRLMLRSENGAALTWRRINAKTPQLSAGQDWEQKLGLPGSFRDLFPWFYDFLKKCGVPI